jgi:hypothetical protein
LGEPFTIRIFVPDGDPQGVKIVERLNWTGVGSRVSGDWWWYRARSVKVAR